MDWNCMLLAIIVILPLLYIIYGVFCKIRNYIVTPVIKSKVFDDLESQDGFGKVRKDSEEHTFLNKTLNTVLMQFNGNKPVSLKRAVFQKDDTEYYIADIEFIWDSKHGQNSLSANRYICLLIGADLDIKDTMKVSKKGGVFSDSPDRTFTERFSISSTHSKTSDELLFREVRDLFVEQDGIYPMTGGDSNEYPGPLGRSVIISNKGIALLGNPDGSRYNVAEMLEFGKKLMSLIKAITDSEQTD